jgi:hypothetical protein
MPENFHMENNEMLRRTNLRLNAIFEFAERTPEFNGAFARSIDDQINTKGYVTHKQYAAIKRITDKFKIDTGLDDDL